MKEKRRKLAIFRAIERNNEILIQIKDDTRTTQTLIQTGSYWPDRELGLGWKFLPNLDISRIKSLSW